MLQGKPKHWNTHKGIERKTMMTIKILGPGCMNCKTLERRTMEALAALNIQANMEKVEDLDRIVSTAFSGHPVW